jgi:hypothetical protein
VADDQILSDARLVKICYLDESGHCGVRPNPEQPIETICGVVTDTHKLFKTQRDHADLLDILRNSGIDVSELKASEIYRGRKEWGKAEPKLRNEVFDSLLEWAKDRKSKFILCPIDSIKFFTRKSSGCEHSNRFQYPFECGAMNALLAIQREFGGSASNKGKTIVVFDEQSEHDERLIRHFEGDLSFTDGYTGYKVPKRAKPPPRLDSIVDAPHFGKSHLAVLIQIADIGAFVTTRYLHIFHLNEREAYSGEREKVEKWYRLIAGNMITHTSIDPPGKDPLCAFFREIRPAGWTAKGMIASGRNTTNPTQEVPSESAAKERPTADH